MVSEQGEPFREYLRSSRLLQFGFLFNLISLSSVIAVYLFLVLTGSDTSVFTMDFQVFYESGQAFLSSPDSIYAVNPNDLPYRYLPAFAAFMSIFTTIPMIPLYLINIISMTIFHLCLVVLTYRLCLSLGINTDAKNFEKTLTIVAITPPHVANLILGQISQLAIFLLFIALYILYSSSKHSYTPFIVVGFLIGVASTLKPFCLIVVPFLIPLSLSERFRFSIQRKQFIGVTLGLITALLPNIVYFLIFPSTIAEFIQVNLAGSLSFHHSTSITRLITDLLSIAESSIIDMFIILLLAALIFLRSFNRFVKEPEDNKDYMFHFTNMMFLILLVYPESWFLFLTYLYAFLAPSMLNLYRLESLSEKAERRLDFLWHGTNNLLAFFSIGIVFHYLLLGFDPVNPLWILVLYVLFDQLINSETIGSPTV